MSEMGLSAMWTQVGAFKKKQPKLEAERNKRETHLEHGLDGGRREGRRRRRRRGGGGGGGAGDRPAVGFVSSALEFPAAALWRRRRIPARQQALVAQVRPLPSSNKVLPSFTEFFF